MPRLGTNLISIITVIGHRSRGHVRTCCNRKLITAYPTRTTRRRPTIKRTFRDRSSPIDLRAANRTFQDTSTDNFHVSTFIIGWNRLDQPSQETSTTRSTIYLVFRLVNYRFFFFTSGAERNRYSNRADKRGERGEISGGNAECGSRREVVWPPLNNDNVTCATVYNQFRCRDRAKRGKKYNKRGTIVRSPWANRDKRE